MSMNSLALPNISSKRNSTSRMETRGVKRKEISSSSNSPPAVPIHMRFPSTQCQKRFENTNYEMMRCRFLNQNYFTIVAPEIIKLVEYFGLHKLVFCENDVNLDICKEFYNNLASNNNMESKSLVRGRVIKVTPESLASFLGCRLSKNSFTCFPEVVEPFSDPFAELSLDIIHQYYLRKQRSPYKSLFNATNMSAVHNILYKVVIGCILPTKTKKQYRIKFPHLVMMYALEHRLDINIALHIYKSISSATSEYPGKRTIYMPFCHILTSFIASWGVDTSKGQILTLSKDYDQIGSRNMRLAGMELREGVMTWKAKPMKDSDDDKETDKADEPVTQAAPAAPVSALDHRLICHMTLLGKKFDLGFRVINRKLERITRRQTEILEVLHQIDIGYSTSSSTSISTSDDDA